MSRLRAARRPSSEAAAGRRARSRVVGAVAVLTAVVVALAGCTSDHDSDEPVRPAPVSTTVPTGTPTSPAAQGAPAGFEGYYAQTVDWSSCGGSYRCADLEAPLSWQDPDAGTITLALKMLPASGTRIGTLFTNPGGPGGSGVDFVEQAKTMFGSDVRRAYDVVGFDPRGVGRSTAVKCLDDRDKDEQLSRWYPSTDAGIQAALKASTVWADACKANTGDLLGHVDTQSAARDMDLMRAVLGEDTLDYLGFSYGTQLGATYAGLFPTHVGRMVLDGAIDTTLTGDQTTLQQAVGFEDALRAYVKDCETGRGCPLSGGVDAGMARIHAFLHQLESRPMPTNDPDRPLTATLGFYGVAVTLYNQSSWSALTLGLSDALTKGRGDQLLWLADIYNARNADGTFSDNSAEAFRAVGCLDDPGVTDLAGMKEQAARIEAAAPTVGEFFSYGGVACKPWPYPRVAQEFDVHAKGAPPIVVVGTTGDPATPYAWAQGLAKTLDSGVLVTFQGEGHTAYRADNTCIAQAVGAFLVDDTVPADGLTCS